MEASLYQKATSFFFLTSETLILYRQSETNCSLETHQDNLNRLEHSRQKTFNALSLVPSLLRLSSATLSLLNDYGFVFGIASPQKFNHYRQ